MKAFLFDMDGVLIDVSQSYRKTIQKVIEFFLNIKMKNNQIQEYKNRGGFNNDWDLTYKILIDNGFSQNINSVIEIFQKYYLGNSYNGLIKNEKWLLNRDILIEINSSIHMGIITGRPKKEALYSLNRFQMEQFFSALITMDDLPKEKSKPDPMGIKKVLLQLQIQAAQAFYFGDSIDDISAALNAGVIPIGIIPPGVERREHKHLLKSHGAQLVLNNINEIKELVK
ncbi:MAG: HAD-IA family hydrolase [Candidatus Aminicenantes bacterium]|nr:HAD-IA family hydrolase [Candidatus Aminicenantes bacterium]